NQSGHNQKQHQEDAPDPNAAAGKAGALGLLVLDQFDDAPQDEQGGPVAAKQHCEPMPVENSHGAHQEHQAEQDEHNCPGHGTRRARRHRHLWRRDYWASHGSPRLTFCRSESRAKGVWTQVERAEARTRLPEKLSNPFRSRCLELAWRLLIPEELRARYDGSPPRSESPEDTMCRS